MIFRGPGPVLNRNLIFCNFSGGSDALPCPPLDPRMHPADVHTLCMQAEKAQGSQQRGLAASKLVCLTKRDSNQPPQLQGIVRRLTFRLYQFKYDSFQKANNKRANQSGMRRLVCILIVLNHRRQVFSCQGPCILARMNQI